MKLRNVFSALCSAALALSLLAACGPAQSAASGPASAPAPAQSLPEASEPQQPGGETATATLPEEMRAMWFSYFEISELDFSSEEALAASVGTMYDACVDMGLNTVLVHVRPFGDAVYYSAIYPMSHYVTGAQGGDPGFDPLPVLINEAHSRGLRFEAWLNPYRVALSDTLPPALDAANPAVANEGWAKMVGSGLYYDPGIPAVRAMVVDGVRELVENYAVDGIHFDDYFYPSFADAEASVAFDADSHAQYGEGQALADWRRQNNDDLVAAVYEVVKAANPAASFGISMAGNNDNNFGQLYANVSKWMAEPGYLDYAMPQLYWGFGYTLSSGTTRFAFENITVEWADLPRHESVRLYAGLDASRIGLGDGGANDPAQWNTGHNLADMVGVLRQNPAYEGYALFRLEHLYSEANPLYRQEAASLRDINQG